MDSMQLIVVAAEIKQSCGWFFSLVTVAESHSFSLLVIRNGKYMSNRMIFIMIESTN